MFCSHFVLLFKGFKVAILMIYGVENPLSIEFLGDDVKKIYFLNVIILTTWSESAPQNRHMMKLDQYCQKTCQTNHCIVSKRLEPDSKYSSYVSIQLPISWSLFFRAS